MIIATKCMCILIKEKESQVIIDEASLTPLCPNRQMLTILTTILDFIRQLSLSILNTLEGMLELM